MVKFEKIEKLISVLLIISPILFIILEYYALQHSNLPTLTAYQGFSVSELAVPLGDSITALGPSLKVIYTSTVSNLSPYAFLINIGFVLCGLTILIGNFAVIKKFVSKYKFIFYLITLILSLGLFIVAIFHTGAPDSEGMHKIGALMLFFGGSFLLIFMGLFSKNIPVYKNASLILGIIGLIGGILFCSFINDPVLGVYRGIVERGNIYATLVWILMSGFYLIFKNSKHNKTNIIN